MNASDLTKAPLWELRIRSLLDKSSAAEHRVGAYILNAPDAVLRGNIQQLAQASGASQATVVRFCRKMGYSGLKELRSAIAQERILDKGTYPITRRLNDDDTIRTMKEKVFFGCVEALNDTLRILDDGQLAQAVDYLCAAPFVEIFGVGGSASVARSALHSFRKIGLRLSISETFNYGYLQMERFNPGDVVLAISRSGETKELVEAVRIVKEKGAIIICLTNAHDSTLSRLADCRLTSICRATMMPGDETYERVAQIAIIRALYAGVAMRLGIAEKELT